MLLHGLPCTLVRRLSPLLRAQSTPLPCRLFSTPSTTSTPVEESPHGRVVYQSTMNRTVKRVKIFSFSTSASAMCLQPLILSRHWATLSEPLTQVALGISSVFSCFIWCTPLLLHYIIKRHMVEMFYQPKTQTFTAVTYTLFMGRALTQFKADDIEDIGGSPTASILDFGTIKVNGNKVLLFDFAPTAFVDKAAYQIIAQKCPAGVAMQELADSKSRRAKRPPVPPTHNKGGSEEPERPIVNEKSRVENKS